jgi:hypothetical protein
MFSRENPRWHFLGQTADNIFRVFSVCTPEVNRDQRRFDRNWKWLFENEQENPAYS